MRLWVYQEIAFSHRLIVLSFNQAAMTPIMLHTAGTKDRLRN